MPVSNKSEALDALKEAANMKNVKIILITENFSSQLHDEIDAIRSRISAPLITEIPGRFEVTDKLSSTQKLMQKVLMIRV